MVLLVMEISWAGPAGIWTRYIPAIILPNRNGLCGYVNNGSGPERSLCLRNGGASRRISRCREAGRRLGFQPERGGAAHPPFTDWSSQHARKMSVARSGPNDTVAWSSRGMGGLNRPPDNRPNLSLVRAAIVKEQRYG